MKTGISRRNPELLLSVAIRSAVVPTKPSLGVSIVKFSTKFSSTMVGSLFGRWVVASILLASSCTVLRRYFMVFPISYSPPVSWSGDLGLGRLDNFASMSISPVQKDTG